MHSKLRASYPRPVSARQLTLAATVIGSSLAFIDATVVIVALPTIERDLELGLSGQQWVYLSYSLALAALYRGASASGRRGRVPHGQQPGASARGVRPGVGAGDRAMDRVHQRCHRRRPTG